MTAAKQAKFAERLTTFDDLPKVLLPNIAQSVVDRRALRLASKNFSQTLEHLECVNAKELEIMRQSQVPPCKNTARVMYKSDMNMQRAIMCAIMSPDNKLHVYVDRDDLAEFELSESVKCFDKHYTLELTLLYPRAQQDPPPRPNLRCAGGFRPLKVALARNGALRDQRGVQVVRFTGNTHVADDAFEISRSLIELLDVNTLKTIGKRAFSGTRLKQLGDLSSLETIGEDAFMWTPLTQLGGMPRLTEIGNGAFLGTRLTQLGKTPLLEKIGDRAFDSTKLKQLGGMPRLTEIGSSAFLGTQLTQLGNMENLTTIGNFAFRGTPLKQLGDMRSLTTIGNFAFAWTQLKQLGDMPSLRQIGKYAFYDTPLKQLGNLSSLTYIGESAFQYARLEQLGDLSSLKTVGEQAFAGTQLGQLANMPSLTTIGDSAFRGTRLTQLGDMRALTTIGEEAFAYCPDLSVVHLPKTLTHVGKNAFEHDHNLGLTGELTVEPGANFVCECVHLADKLKKIKDVRVENEGPGTYRIKHIYNEYE